MSASPSSAAQAARERLAARLQVLRVDAGLSGQELALRCGWSASKRSRIENARTPPSDADVRDWCAACDANDQAPDLIAANQQADEMYVHWKKLHRHGMRRAQSDVLPLYVQTRHFRIYCSNVVPGILQTEAYATALLGTIARFQQTPDDAPAAAASRLERSDLLHEGNHTFAFLLEETVLRYRIGDTATMSAQLGYLLAVMPLHNVSLGIIPFSAERTMWPLEAFYLFDDHRVSSELLTAAVNVTAPSEIQTYAEAFAAMSRQAVYGSHARALITEAITSLG
ncbi:XRE family transcriptional regulator [Streptomyces triticagri]|uniref:XRE family transcriptional regulator n=1 Tax=Streptomyces triticagri TaxID=2293568 RepID=A0A372LZD0_9ACTN|nr:helix-turn-helix transcriptional regulator [Streptomyces triticagri]RFU83623.1 XRE family transcriptional regulator [Streptomyces triticagri]